MAVSPDGQRFLLLAADSETADGNAAPSQIILASLKHPNIAIIHGLEQAGDVQIAQASSAAEKQTA